MSKDEKVGTSTATGNVLITWIKFVIWLLVTARLGSGNFFRFVDWKNSMKQPDNLNRMPYSPPGKEMFGGGQAGGNFAAKMAARAAKAALEKKKKQMMAAAKAAASGNLKGAFSAGKSNITQSGKQELPYSLIGGDIMSDWIGRNIAFSFSKQRMLWNLYFQKIGEYIIGNNWKSGKSELYLYVLNLVNIFFISWFFFWILFFGQALLGNLITIWGASIFGALISKSWGSDWANKAMDFGYGTISNYLFHGLFCIIPWLIFFCLELPIIGIAQPLMILIFFWYNSFNIEGGGAQYHWKMFWKYPRAVFYIICALFIMSSVVELSGDHLADPRGAQAVMYPFIIVPMLLILIVEYIHRYDRGGNSAS